VPRSFPSSLSSGLASSAHVCALTFAPPPPLRRAFQLPAVRDLDLSAACEDLGLPRLAAWINAVLSNPHDCCDVAVLDASEYVHLARRMHVRFIGPPSPSAQLPRAAAPRDFTSPLERDAAGSDVGGPRASFSSLPSRFAPADDRGDSCLVPNGRSLRGRADVDRGAYI